MQAQNYHIFTPALNKDWALAWGSPTWIKDFPFANAAYSYNFKPGQGGMLTLRRDALMKLRRGVTSVEEVLKETAADKL